MLNELKKYNVELLDKQRIVAISKADLLDGELKELIEKEIYLASLGVSFALFHLLQSKEFYN